MNLKKAHHAFEKNVPWLCVDLTVNLIPVDWNKSVAARLLPLFGLSIGVLETNGHHYYKVAANDVVPPVSWCRMDKI